MWSGWSMAAARLWLPMPMTHGAISFQARAPRGRNQPSALPWVLLRHRDWFYYLQSRYYDPVTHRFINADSYSSTGQGIIGYNMFAYCNNSPVIQADHIGEFGSLTPVSAVVSAAVNVATTYIAAKATGRIYSYRCTCIGCNRSSKCKFRALSGPFYCRWNFGAYLCIYGG